jgi:hypothetical protein
MGGRVIARESREGWPLTVETEANGDSWSTWFLPWLVRWARRAGTIDFCPALAALLRQVQNIIFLAEHFYTILVPIAQQPGQAVVLGLCVSGHSYVRLSRTVCVLSSFKGESTVKFSWRKLGKTVHKVTEADSCWSMLRKSHLKNFTKVLAMVKTCPKGPEEGGRGWGWLLFLPPYQELIGNSPIGKHGGRQYCKLILAQHLPSFGHSLNQTCTMLVF